jgi:hypothetical protein
LNRTDQTLEAELQRAFVKGQTARLARFAHWCASQTATDDMTAICRDAIELARQRAEGEIEPKSFATRAEWLRGQMPLAAAVIGLKHGAPNAMRLLAIAAALDTGPLTAALQASRNQRGYERMREQHRLQQDERGGGPVIVALQGARPLTDAGAPPTLAEARCAERQLETWRRL